MKRINAVFLSTILFAYSVSTSADGPAIGPNGGQVRDAGKYHLELVVKDTALTVYVIGNKDTKVATKGATGSATVLAGKGTSNVKLEPGGENVLAGNGTKWESRYRSIAEPPASSHHRGASADADKACI